jgi:hypothetical protein
MIISSQSDLEVTGTCGHGEDEDDLEAHALRRLNSVQAGSTETSLNTRSNTQGSLSENRYWKCISTKAKCTARESGRYSVCLKCQIIRMDSRWTPEALMLLSLETHKRKSRTMRP